MKRSISAAITRLTAANVPSPRMNAELLLMFTLGCDRAYLHAHSDRLLTADENSRYQAALDERARGVPAQYITGHQEFWGLDFIVTPAVLIPRPETEHVIETVLNIWKEGPRTSDLKRDPLNATAALRIADVGTGSGCIAIALAKEFPHAEIHATDISPSALEIAGLNSARHGVNNRIHFHETDLLEALDPITFDFIVSNPPYVGQSEEDQVQIEVRKFEPRDAVFAGPTGTEVIARLIPQAHSALKPGGWLIVEISGTIATQVEKLLHSWDGAQVILDLQSIPRVVSAQKAQV